MIYLDNAATTFPKPEEVYQFTDQFYRTCGVNVGLCFPFKIVATFDARRPKVCPSASITYQVLSTSSFLCMYVFILFFLSPLH